ncbi:MAG TPA: Ig-like domain-containing protein [Gemmatimonadaceae bacterium]|nr:Ig-like domain-containing protein [Gemmatimonadaceae bacterium]
MRWFRRGMPLVHAVLFASACGVTDTDEPIPVTEIVVSPTSMQVATGGTGAIDVEVKDASGHIVRDRRVVWASSNPGVASVSDNGVVTGVSSGRADVAATSEGKSAIAAITVVSAPPVVASVRIVPDKVSVLVAGGTNLVATPYDSRGVAIGGRTVVWTTNNVTVAAVAQNGRVTGLLPGTAVITAVVDGRSATSTVTVSLAPVAKVEVTPADVSVSSGKSTQLTAQLTDASGNMLSGRTVTWTSSDTRLVTVDAAGVARAVRRGTVVVTATSEGKFGTATVRVP